MAKKPKDQVVWVALSSRGYIAPFIGVAFTRAGLKQRYESVFHGDLEVAGYKPVKATLVLAAPAPRRTRKDGRA